MQEVKKKAKRTKENAVIGPATLEHRMSLE